MNGRNNTNEEREHSTDLHIAYSERLQQSWMQKKQQQVTKWQATKSLDAFWRNVRVTPRGCWLWNGLPSAVIWYTNTSNQEEQSAVNPQHLAFAMEIGSIFPDHYSKFLSMCDTPMCIRPAHKIEVTSLKDIYWLLVDLDMGEDDRIELASRFKARVDEGVFSALLWDGKPAAKRSDFEQWLCGEGEQLQSTFRQSYTLANTSERQYPEAHSGVGWGRPDGNTWRGKWQPPWWERVGVPEAEIPAFIQRYQELALTKGERELDDATALSQIERLCNRIVIQDNDCWTWDKPGANVRLFAKGPLVSPHEVLWTLFSGIHVSDRWDIRAASHDSYSWCINPSHSDLLANVSSATFWLFGGQNPPIPWPKGATLTKEEMDRVRILLFRAVETGEIPFIPGKNNNRTRDVWRTDVLLWARNHHDQVAEMARTLFRSENAITSEQRGAEEQDHGGR